MVERLTRDGDGVAVVVGAGGHRKDDRPRCSARGVGSDGHAGSRRRDRAQGRPASWHARAGIRRNERRARCSAADQPLEPGTVLVIDEASMLGTSAARKLLDADRRRARQAGHRRRPAQLPAIEAGGILGALATRCRSSSSSTTADSRRPGSGMPWRCSATATPTKRLAGTKPTGASWRSATEPTRCMTSCFATGTPPTTRDGSLMIAHYRADVPSSTDAPAP